MERVAQINKYERMLSWNESSFIPRRRKIRRRKFSRRSGRRFYTLARLAHDTHQRLSERGSPLRLCIYREEEDLFMDVVAMDKTEKINHSFKRDITHDSLKTLVKRIHNQMGLILDYSV